MRGCPTYPRPCRCHCSPAFTRSIFPRQFSHVASRFREEHNLSPAGGTDMAKTKQFKIAIDHQPGAVARIAKTLGDAKVNILCLLGTSQGTSGTLQLIVEDPRRARKALDAARISYQEIPAEQYELPNKAGSRSWPRR